MKLLNGLRNLLDRLKAPVVACPVVDLPDALAPRRLYLIGDEGEDAWQAAMLCPCGCGSTIRVSLVPGDKPGWTARTEDDGVTSLWPSVARRRGCCAHFLAEGRIHWV